MSLPTPHLLDIMNKQVNAVNDVVALGVSILRVYFRIYSCSGAARGVLSPYLFVCVCPYVMFALSPLSPCHLCHYATVAHEHACLSNSVHRATNIVFFLLINY